MIHRWRAHKPSRLIDLLREKCPEAKSLRALKRMLEMNRCRVNGRVERFASASLGPGDTIEFQPCEIAARPSISILLENESILVIDKPIGLVCTDDEIQRFVGRKVFLAHRLDKDTTGILLLGKSPAATRQLQQLFKERTIEKQYLALVDGVPIQERGTSESHFIKKGSFQGQTLWGSSSHGRGVYARTDWQRLSHTKTESLLLCSPWTGRTHQIRVHLAELGHPVLIDRQYSERFKSKLFASRPLLHARQLQFEWEGKPIDISAPLPDDFQSALASLQIGVIA